MSSSNGYTSDYRLTGVWEIDVDRTMKFNKNMVTKQIRVDLLRCFSENTVIRFEKGKLIKNVKGHSCASGEKSGMVKGSKSVFSYDVIFDNGGIIVLRLKFRQSELETAKIFHFDDEYSFWVEGGDKDLFIREYYKKVRK